MIEMADDAGPLTCVECGQELKNVAAWKAHIPECIPASANLTTAELDAAYEKALLDIHDDPRR